MVKRRTRPFSLVFGTYIAPLLVAALTPHFTIEFATKFVHVAHTD